MSDHRGRFVWHELMTSDPKGAQKFYGDVVGWTFHNMPMEGLEGGYTMLGTGPTPDTSVGGIAKLESDPAAPAGAPPHWLGYVAVPDVDAGAKKAESLGAKVIVAPTDIPTVGRFSVIADPQGAVLSLFKGNQEMPEPTGMPTDRQISWNELMTTDQAGAWAFHSEMFGWEKGEAIDMGPMGTYQIVLRKGQPIGGTMKIPEGMPMPPSWIYYFRVPALDASIAAATAGGGKLCNGPMEVPGGDRVAQLTDPQGATFGLHEVKKA
jgi:uncharacterized protein